MSSKKKNVKQKRNLRGEKWRGWRVRHSRNWPRVGVSMSMCIQHRSTEPVSHRTTQKHHPKHRSTEPQLASSPLTHTKRRKKNINSNEKNWWHSSVWFLSCQPQLLCNLFFISAHHPPSHHPPRPSPAAECKFIDTRSVVCQSRLKVKEPIKWPELCTDRCWLLSMRSLGQDILESPSFRHSY